MQNYECLELRLHTYTPLFAFMAVYLVKREEGEGSFVFMDLRDYLSQKHTHR
jgi:hypothetical protein